MAQFTRIEVAQTMKESGMVPLFFHSDVEVAKKGAEEGDDGVGLVVEVLHHRAELCGKHARQGRGLRLAKCHEGERRLAECHEGGRRLAKCHEGGRRLAKCHEGGAHLDKEHAREGDERVEEDDAEEEHVDGGDAEHVGHQRHLGHEGGGELGHLEELDAHT